jgi:hypothetical protein
MVNKFSKIRPSPQEGICVSRMDLEYGGDDSAIVYRKKVELDSCCKCLETEDDSYEEGKDKRISFVDRKVISNKTAVACGKSLFDKLERFEDKRSKGLNLGRIGKTDKKRVKRATVVAEGIAEQCTEESRCDPLSGGAMDRCISLRLGSLHTMGKQGREKERADGSWSLEQRMELESERADSSTACTTPLLQPFSNSVDKALANTLGQHSNSVQFEQMCSVEESGQSNEEAIQLCVGKTVNLSSSLHKRDEEYKSGQPLEVMQSRRLLFGDIIVDTHAGVVKGTNSMRFVRDQSEPQTSNILHTVTERQSMFCERRL